MSDQPWPTLWQMWRCYEFRNGLTSDRSGWDAVNAWGETASPAELKRLEDQAYWLGYLVGMGLGYFTVNLLFRLFFGDHHRN